MNAINTDLKRRISNKLANPKNQNLTTEITSMPDDSSDNRPDEQFNFIPASQFDLLGERAVRDDRLLSEMLYFDRF